MAGAARLYAVFRYIAMRDGSQAWPAPTAELMYERAMPAMAGEARLYAARNIAANGSSYSGVNVGATVGCDGGHSPLLQITWRRKNHECWKITVRPEAGRSPEISKGVLRQAQDKRDLRTSAQQTLAV